MSEGYGRATARFYDRAYAAQGVVGPDAGFYRRLAVEAGGPLLELGCGTGRVLLPIAEALPGVPCHGLDLSPEMLEALRAKRPPGNVSLTLASMTDFALEAGPLEFVYSAFRAFQHLYTVADQLACLACVRRHLAPGGTFAFDVFNPRLDRIAIEQEPENEDLRFEQDGEEVIRYVKVTRDPPAQLTDVTMRYERRRDGAVVGNEIATFQMRWFHRFELEHLLSRAGFDEITVLGDFDGSALATESPHLVVVAR